MSGGDEEAQPASDPGRSDPGDSDLGRSGPGRPEPERADSRRGEGAPGPGEPTHAESAQQARTVAGAGDSSPEREASELAALNNSYFHTNIINGPVVAPQATFGTAGGSAQEETS